jgi:diguanylate cyclase (GGDEF)-like protein
MNHTPSRIASSPAVLFANLHEQADRVLGKTGGFYVVTVDHVRDRVRLAYFVLDGEVQRGVFLHCRIRECDVVREGKTLFNDHFSKRISGDVVNSISVPMTVGGVVIGAFGALAHEAREYDARDAAALVAIAEVGGLALENVHMVADLEKARREADRLEEIGRAMTASLSLTDVLRTVVDAAVELTEADAAAVWLLHGEDQLEAAMTAGKLAPERGLIVPMPPMLRHQPGEAGSAYVFEDVQRAPHVKPEDLNFLRPARSGVAIALINGDQLLGALSLGNRDPHGYTAEDVRLVERLSYQAAIAVANARMHEEIIGLSLTDPLTGLPNRRHLEIFLEKEFAAAQRGRTLSVILFDVDNFKIYNDAAGHQAGDQALRAFADVLRRETRAMNLAARYGGDEFITILADVDRALAHKQAERVAAAVARHPLLRNANIRASAGVASYELHMNSADDLIRAADADMYARKAVRKVVG